MIGAAAAADNNDDDDPILNSVAMASKMHNSGLLHRVRTLKIIILYGQNVPTNFFRKARAPSHNSSVLHSQ